MSSRRDRAESPAGAPSNRSPVEGLRSLVAGRPSQLVRLAGVGLVLAGVAHLVGPQALLRTARVGYDLVLDVDFDPRENATRRARTLGVAMVVAGAHLVYHGTVIPAERDG